MLTLKIIIVLILLSATAQDTDSTNLNLKFLQLQDNNIFYPSVKKITKSGNSETNYVLAYQKKVSKVFQIFITIFKEDMSIIKNEIKLSTQIETEDNIEPKVITFENMNIYVIVWKSKANCPSMKFIAATFNYGETTPNSTKELTQCNSKYGELQSMLNYDVAVTKDNKIFLIWHQKNGKNDSDYDIYFQIHNSDLTIMKEMTNITDPNYGNQMYPSLFVIETDKNLLTYQNDNYETNEKEGFVIYGRIYDNKGDIVQKDFKISSDLEKAIFPKVTKLSEKKFIVTYLNDSNKEDKHAKFDLKGNYLIFDNGEITPDSGQINIKNEISNFDNKNLARSCGQDNNSACSFSSSSVWYIDLAEYAIDGKKDICYFSNNSQNEWFRVHLTDKDSKIPIKKIKLHTRTNCCPERLDGFYASIGQMTQDYKSSKIPNNQKLCYVDKIKKFSLSNTFVEFYCEGEGNMIEIGLGTIKPIQICELQIFGRDEQLIFPNINKVDNDFLISYKPNDSVSGIKKISTDIFGYDFNKSTDFIYNIPLFENYYQQNKLPLIFNENEFQLFDYLINEEQMNFSCDKSCSKGCYNGPFKCFECALGYIKSDDGKCLNDQTAEGYFLNNSIYQECGNNCPKNVCGSNCLECTTYLCTKCEPNKFAVEGKKNCSPENIPLDSYYFDNNIFRRCVSGCIKCNNPTSCEICDNTFYKNISTNKCLRIPIGHYIDGENLKKCRDNCKSCKDGNTCDQ